MYLDFYGFTEKPFNITPNPRFVFLSKIHREAFAHLLYGVRDRAGFIELTGEVGTGKTTVLRTLLGQLDEEGYRTALIFNPRLSALELLGAVCREFGIPTESRSTAQLHDDLNAFLLEENAAGRTVVLVIDEAQNLEPGVLEQVRLISNLETKTDKLIQIVLAGQPELGEMLERQELRQLNQRITVRYHLLPMDMEDTGAYIAHRLAVAGGGGAVVFPSAALKRIYRFSAGYPRLINIVCDRVLLVAYSEDKREVSSEMIATAIRELRRQVRRPLWRRPRFWPAVAGTAALCLALGFFALDSSAPPTSASLPGVTATGVPLPSETDLRKIASSLQPGARGTEVTQLQTFLHASGWYEGKPSGIFDQATVASIRKFQAACGLEQDGMPGSRTLLLLYREGEKSAPARPAKGKTGT
ncbi:MAG: AAA family ATPase [Geobacter sp.]|nr:AAA family ATPase [Geobacter sp.]